MALPAVGSSGGGRGAAADFEWLDVVLDGYCVLAWHDATAVGQAALVDAGDGCEMIVFVDGDYHGAGIGTRLVEALLSYGREQGVRDVTDDHGYDLEMALTMTPASS